MRYVQRGAGTAPRSSRSDEDAWCAALVERVAAGEARALEVLYDRYARPAYSLARRVTGDSVFAEEVVQEVFLAVWRQAGRFDATRGGFAGWLFAAVHNKAVDAVRREEAVRRRALALQAIEALDASDPPANRPEDAVEERMRGERVCRALRALPDSQREAMTLAYYGGYTQREIATLTMTPIGTVKTRMHRAMPNLRAALGDLADVGNLGGPAAIGDTGTVDTATVDAATVDTQAPRTARVRSREAGEARVARAAATDDCEGGRR